MIPEPDRVSKPALLHMGVTIATLGPRGCGRRKERERMADTHVWHFLRQRLRAGARAVLLVVVRSDHETPGKPGFKMAVALDGPPRGSVGGGILEHALCERAREALRQDREDSVLCRHELTGSGSGGPEQMICGGALTVALCPLCPSDLTVVERILDCVRRGRPGRLRLCPKGLAFEGEESGRERHTFTQTANEDWLYEERLGLAGTVYIIGGGHVGLALSRALATLDLRVVVIDERPHVETMRRNRYAHERRVVAFDAVGDGIPEGDSTYVVIATPAHSADECVLRQVVCKRVRYLGMLGSRTKVREIMAHMRADKFPEDALRRVHAPVGVPISSHTPAEIALSIAAQIVQVRNS